MSTLPDYTFDWTAALVNIRPNPACEGTWNNPGARRARRAQNELLVRTLYPLVEGDWRLMARVVIEQGYYSADAEVGIVATTLRNLGVKLGFARRWASRSTAWSNRMGTPPSFDL